MNTEQRELYEKVKAFSIDDPTSSFPYSKKLAKENGWSLAYAERVIEEYRRYIVLAITSEQPASPSEPVDQAWHVHMTYTHS